MILAPVFAPKIDQVPIYVFHFLRIFAEVAWHAFCWKYSSNIGHCRQLIFNSWPMGLNLLAKTGWSLHSRQAVPIDSSHRVGSNRFLGYNKMKTPWRCQVEKTLHRIVGVYLWCSLWNRSFWIPLKMIVKSCLRKHLENLTKSKLKSPLHNVCIIWKYRFRSS